MSNPTGKTRARVVSAAIGIRAKVLAFVVTDPAVLAARSTVVAAAADALVDHECQSCNTRITASVNTVSPFCPCCASARVIATSKPYRAKTLAASDAVVAAVQCKCGATSIMQKSALKASAGSAACSMCGAEMQVAGKVSAAESEPDLDTIDLEEENFGVTPVKLGQTEDAMEPIRSGRRVKSSSANISSGLVKELRSAYEDVIKRYMGSKDDFSHLDPNELNDEMMGILEEVGGDGENDEADDLAIAVGGAHDDDVSDIWQALWDKVMNPENKKYGFKIVDSSGGVDLVKAGSIVAADFEDDEMNDDAMDDLQDLTTASAEWPLRATAAAEPRRWPFAVTAKKGENPFAKKEDKKEDKKDTKGKDDDESDEEDGEEKSKDALEDNQFKKKGDKKDDKKKEKSDFFGEDDGSFDDGDNEGFGFSAPSVLSAPIGDLEMMMADDGDEDDFLADDLSMTLADDPLIDTGVDTGDLNFDAPAADDMLTFDQSMGSTPDLSMDADGGIFMDMNTVGSELRIAPANGFEIASADEMPMSDDGEILMDAVDLDDTVNACYIVQNGNRLLAMKGHYAVAALTPSAAKDVAAVMYTDGFSEAVLASVSKDGMRKALASYNFQPVRIPVQTKATVSRQVSAFKAQAAAEQAKKDQVMADCFAIAATGLARGMWKSTPNPLKAAFESEMSRLGVNKPGRISAQLFAQHGPEYSRVLCSLASQLASKTPETRRELADTLDMVADEPIADLPMDSDGYEDIDTGEDDGMEMSLASRLTNPSPVRSSRQVAALLKPADVPSLVTASAMANAMLSGDIPLFGTR
jgi:hypothetical protein